MFDLQYVPDTFAMGPPGTGPPYDASDPLAAAENNAGDRCHLFAGTTFGPSHQATRAHQGLTGLWKVLAGPRFRGDLRHFIWVKGSEIQTLVVTS
jgi:hypothetical protein